MKSLVAELGDLSAPLDVCCGVYTLRYADRDKKKIHGKLQQLFKESEGLIDVCVNFHFNGKMIVFFISFFGFD